MKTNKSCTRGGWRWLWSSSSISVCPLSPTSLQYSFDTSRGERNREKKRAMSWCWTCFRVLPDFFFFLDFFFEKGMRLYPPLQIIIGLHPSHSHLYWTRVQMDRRVRCVEAWTTSSPKWSLGGRPSFQSKPDRWSALYTLVTHTHHDRNFLFYFILYMFFF